MTKRGEQQRQEYGQRERKARKVVDSRVDVAMIARSGLAGKGT